MSSFSRQSKMKFFVPAVVLLAITISVLAPVNRAQAQSQMVTTLYNFGFTNGDPTAPYGTIAQGRDGNFYGTSIAGPVGGVGNNGVVFKITAGGAMTALYAIQTTDGAQCNGLVLGTDGNFYGTCQRGGTQNGNPGGTIIKVTPAGVLTVLHNFTMIGNTDDVCLTLGTPVQGNDGNFYGTTASCGANNFGAAYKFSLAGAYTQLYSFQWGSNDVGNPYGLVQGSDGNFYGMSGGEFAGGAFSDGAVFKLSPGGKESLVYSFKGAPTDGSEGNTSLIQASDGNFYGSTLTGGSSGNSGVIFKLTPAGVETVLYNFGTLGLG